jgi:hypothetical protein
VASCPDTPPSLFAFIESVRHKLTDPQVKVLNPVLDAWPDSLTSEQVAAAAGYAHNSGNFNNLRGQLRSIGLVDYPDRGTIRAADWLFPEQLR